MKRRGRPPHPDILTPREWEVLDLLRTGLSNPEIAERLGVTRDAVKYHVSEILSKLAVTSREEAAVWRPYKRPWWAGTFAAVGRAATQLSPLARIAAIGASVAAIAGVVVFASGVLEMGMAREEQIEFDVNPGLSPSSMIIAPSGEPSFSAELKLSSEMALPEGVALLLETGCSQCDGQTTGLLRMSREADGTMHQDRLVSASRVGDIELPVVIVDRPKGPQSAEVSIPGFAISPDGQEIIVGICRQCAAMGLPGLSPDSGTVLYRSVDGGQTWSEFAHPGGGAVLGWAGNGRVLMVIHTPEDAFEVFLYPDREPVSRPETATGIFPAPIALGDGTIAWPDRDGTLKRTDGTVIVQASEDSCPCGISAVAKQSSGDQLMAVSWAATTPSPEGRLSVFSSKGAHMKTFTAFQQPRHLAWVSESLLVANMAIPAEDLIAVPPAPYLGVLPVLIDLESGEIHPIVDPFLKPDAERGRNNVLGVQLR